MAMGLGERSAVSRPCGLAATRLQRYRMPRNAVPASTPSHRPRVRRIEAALSSAVPAFRAHRRALLLSAPVTWLLCRWGSAAADAADTTYLPNLDLSRYVKRKALDAPETYLRQLLAGLPYVESVPRMMATAVGAAASEVSGPIAIAEGQATYEAPGELLVEAAAEARGQLRAGPAGGTRMNWQALARYLGETGQAAAGAAVASRALGELDSLDLLLLRVTRMQGITDGAWMGAPENEPEVLEASARVAAYVTALGDLKALLPAGVVERAEKLGSVGAFVVPVPDQRQPTDTQDLELELKTLARLTL